MATMSKKQMVYFGPSSSIYAKHNSELAAGTFVTVKWAEKMSESDEEWYYITFGGKQGYVPASSVKDAGNVGTAQVLRKSQRYMHADCPVYYSSLSGSEKAGSVSYGESIQFLNKKEIGSLEYAFIEYQVTNDKKKKRGWVDTNKIGVNRITPTLTVGQHPSDQDLSSDYYHSKNFYYPNYLEECTAYCWGRACEKCGRYIVFNGSNNGAQWYENCDCEVSGVTKSSVPVTNSICSCSGSKGAGHVIFVELVKDGYVYYTEAHIPDEKDGVVKKCPVSEFPKGRTAYGYLVL